MFESPRSLWQHFAVAIIVAVLVIMSHVNANNENDQCMLSGKTRTEKPCTGRLYQLSEALSRVAGLPVNSHVCRRHWDEFRRKDVRCSCPTHDRKTPSRLDSKPIPRRFYPIFDEIGSRTTAYHPGTRWCYHCKARANKQFSSHPEFTVKPRKKPVEVRPGLTSHFTCTESNTIFSRLELTRSADLV